jgi:hypothetical protein
MRIETRIVERKETAVAKQRLGKHFSAATNQQETIDELLETIFSIRSLLRLHDEVIGRVRVSKFGLRTVSREGLRA